MEREFKWMASPELLAEMETDGQLAKCCTAVHRLHMQADYFETTEGLLRQAGAALRLRKENNTSICCMKQGKHIENGCTVRNEYEVEAPTIEEGLQHLPEAGAPRALCEAIVCSELVTLAHTDFHRTAMLLHHITADGGCTAELALDIGTLGNDTASVPFSEAELEFKAGDDDAFLALAAMLETEFSLRPQPLSKLARAVNAGK